MKVTREPAGQLLDFANSQGVLELQQPTPFPPASGRGPGAYSPTDYLLPAQLRTGDCLAAGEAEGSRVSVDCELLARLQSAAGRESERPWPRSVHVD